AAQNGQPANLDAQRAAAARYIIELGIDDIAKSGDSPNGLNGFLNHTDVPIFSGTFNGSWSSLTFPADSGKVIFDVNTVLNQVVDSTNQVEYADTVLLPVAQYNLIASSLVSTAGNRTILEFLIEAGRKRWPGFDIQPWYSLKGAGAGGSTDRMMVYRKDPE